MWSKSPETPPSSPAVGNGASSHASNSKDSSHFNPIGDFLQAFQSALIRWSTPSSSSSSASKESPKVKLRRASTVNDIDTLRFEHIELTQFNRVELDPTQHGIGHSFISTELLTPDWCDLCGDFIWGLYTSKDNLICQNCNYTCHQQCSGMVTLNCKTQAAETIGVLEEDEDFEMKFEEPDFRYSEETLKGENLKNKIARFNSTWEDYQIEMHDGCETFHGFIRVHMNLSRPINVLAGTRPPSIYDIIYDEEENAEKTLTSFYLPRDTVKAIHVTSKTTAQQLISALLKKFKVVDNPRKFRLYEKSWKGDGTMKGFYHEYFLLAVFFY
ncbi:Ras association (RalGDS AF-6) domain member [Chamberlinius hualienensis]